jgi:hypothetical protein
MNSLRGNDEYQPNTRLLQWLKERYQARGASADALDMAQRLFRAYPLAATIERYREIRQIAQQMDRWEAVRAEIMTYVQQSHITALQIEIALDEGQVELALQLLQAERQTESRRNGPYGSDNFDVGIEVAKITRLHASILQAFDGSIKSWVEVTSGTGISQHCVSSIAICLH